MSDRIKLIVEIPISRDSDNTYPEPLKIERRDAEVIFMLDNREFNVSYKRLQQVMRIYAQAESEESE